MFLARMKTFSNLNPPGWDYSARKKPHCDIISSRHNRDGGSGSESEGEKDSQPHIGLQAKTKARE